jgi:hypothetical protein
MKDTFNRAAKRGNHNAQFGLDQIALAAGNDESLPAVGMRAYPIEFVSTATEIADPFLVGAGLKLDHETFGVDTTAVGAESQR